MKYLVISAFLFNLAFTATVTNVIDVNTFRQTPSFKNKENLKFKITYFGITAGYAEMNAKVQDDDLKLELKTWTTALVRAIYTLNLNFLSIVNPDTLINSYTLEDSEEKGTLRFIEQKFKNDKLYYKYIRNKKLVDSKTVDNVIPAYDVLSAFYISRKLPLSENIVFSAPAYYKSRQEVILIKMIGKKTIKTEWGKMECLVVMPVMKFRGLFTNTGNIIIYLSNDEHRVPVLMESELAVGSFKAKLIKGFPE